MVENQTTDVPPVLGAFHQGYSDGENFLGKNLSFDFDLLNEKLLKGGLHIHGDTFEVVVEYISICLIPFIVFMGVIGNAVCFVIFTSTYMRFKSSSMYLAVLSLSDGIFLLCVFVVWLARVNVPLLQYNFVCKMVFYLMYLFCFSSSWIVVAFTTERYILVYHPLIKDRYCTRKGALVVCGIILLLGSVGYVVAFWSYGVNLINDVPFCMPLTNYYDVITIVTGVDMTITFVIPVMIIVILNIKILIKIHKMKKLGDYLAPWGNDCSMDRGTPRRRPCYRTSISRSGSMHVTFFTKSLDALIDESSHVRTRFGQEYGLECLRRGYVQRRTARFLLFASSMFIILNLPSYIVRIRAFVREVMFSHTEPSKAEIQWRKVFQICYFLNFAIDFAVYCSCSETFRAALKKFVLRFLKKESKTCSSDSA